MPTDGMNPHYIVSYKDPRVKSMMPLLYFFMVGWLTSFLNCSLATLIAIAAWIVNTRLVGLVCRISHSDMLQFHLPTLKSVSCLNINFVITTTLQVAIMTACGAIDDGKVGIMTTLGFQYNNGHRLLCVLCKYVKMGLNLIWKRPILVQFWHVYWMSSLMSAIWEFLRPMCRKSVLTLFILTHYKW